MPLARHASGGSIWAEKKAREGPDFAVISRAQGAGRLAMGGADGPGETGG